MRLYLYDRNNENHEKRLSNDNEATWNATGFEKNDSIFYYITNDGSEFTYWLNTISIAAKPIKYFSDKWDVNGMTHQ